MPGRRRAWADVRYGGTILASDGFLKDDLLEEMPDTDVKTVVRIIFDLWVMVNSSEESEGENVVDLVIGVTSQEAFIAETLPDPNAVGDYPMGGWLYAGARPVSVWHPASGMVVPVNAHFKADLRAMRKVDRGVLFAYWDNLGVQGITNPLRIYGRIRSLVLT